MSSGSSQALATEEVVTGLLADTLEARLEEGLSSDTRGGAPHCTRAEGSTTFPARLAGS